MNFFVFIVVLLNAFSVQSHVSYEYDDHEQQNGNCLFAACECIDDRVNCRGVELTKIPSFATSNKTQYNELSLSNNFIEYLDSDRLSGLRLKHLWIRSNGLKSISEHAFRDVIAIQSISFQSNLLQTVESSIFEPVKTSLKILNLNLNKLQKVPNLSRFELLKTLNLSSNQITELKMPVFPSSLKTLSLDHNQISELYENAFENVYNLEHLHLQFNNISSIETNSFQNLHNLLQLDLSHNSIKRISSEWFYRLHKIELIQLGYQQASIEFIEEYAFDSELPRTHVTRFNLEGNEFDKLEDRVFCKSSYLKNTFNDIISFNESIFNNVNPCMFERISSTTHRNSFTVLKSNNVKFDCDLYNHLLKLNLNVTFKVSDTKLYDYRNCEFDVEPYDVCARQTGSNCYEALMNLGISKMAENETYNSIKLSNDSQEFIFHAGDNLKIDCIIHSLDNDMLPEVEWRFANGSSIIETNENPKNLAESFRKSYTRSLYFINLQRDSIGKYICGRKDDPTELVFDMDVKAVPTAPIIRDVVIYEFKSFIKWHVEDFGGLDVLAFHLDWRKSSSPQNDYHTYSVKMHKYEDEIYIPFRIYNTSIIRIYLENKLGLSNKSDEYSVANKQILSDRAKCMEELRQVFDKCLRFRKYDNEPDEIDAMFLERR